MRRQSLLLLISLLSLSGCVNNPPEESSSSEVWSEADGDKAFMALENSLKPIIGDDRQGAIIKTRGDKPLIAVDFEAEADLSLSSETPSSKEGLRPYRVEVFGDAKASAFNCSKAKEFKCEIAFEDAMVSLLSSGSELASITQTFSTYIAETKKENDEYEQGFYADLKHAALTEILLENLLGVEVEEKTFVDISETYGSLSSLFPLTTTYKSITPYFLNFLRGRFDEKKLTIKTNSKGDYSLEMGIKDKDDFSSFIKGAIDDIFDGYTGIATIRNIINNYVDSALSSIKTVKGSLVIPFSETKLGQIDADFDITLDTKTSSLSSSYAEYLDDVSIKSVSFCLGINLFHGTSVDVSSFPNNLLDHNVWKELEY